MKRIFIVTKDGRPLGENDRCSITYAIFPEDAKEGKLIVFSKEFYSKPAKLLPELVDGDIVAIIERDRGKPCNTANTRVNGELRDFLVRNVEKDTYTVITRFNELHKN